MNRAKRSAQGKLRIEDDNSKLPAERIKSKAEPKTKDIDKLKPKDSPGDRKTNPWKHVIVWFVGVIVAALLPFIWASQSGKPGEGSPSIYKIFGAGDLYLISVIVLIAGLTEIALLFRRIRHDVTLALLVLSAFLFAFLFTARYAGASSIADAASNSWSPPHSIAYLSLAAFVISALHSSICVLLAAGVE
jgi:hypothetical protein